MKAGPKTLMAIGISAATGAAVLAVAFYAVYGHIGRGDHGYGAHHSGLGELESFSMERNNLIDVNGDGLLSQEDIDQARIDRHNVHDANGDGNLVLEEFAGLLQETTRPLAVRTFLMLDTDGDSVIAHAEFDRPFAGIVARLDRNGDGALSMRDRWNGRHNGDRWDQR